MFTHRLGRCFSSAKEQYSRLFVVRLLFGEDGYYEASPHRLEFRSFLADFEKKGEALVLGGSSFPFSYSTFFVNCEAREVAERFARENVFVRTGVATSLLEEVERVSSGKFGNLANFYDMKLDI